MCTVMNYTTKDHVGASKVRHSEQTYIDLQCNMYKTEGAVGVKMQ